VSSRKTTPSHLPSFLLPCPSCGNRVVIRTVTRVPVDSKSRGEDLDDITYSCEQCGMTLTRTVRA
jgi:predicted RNA-binding Zn-ribbon protein involved in translation (DUF1610 family)